MGNIKLKDLEIGERIVDKSWEWEFRAGADYTDITFHTNKCRKNITKTVTWIVVAKDHYPEGGVTLLSEELIGNFSFDNSVFIDDWGSNHWGASGMQNSSKQERPDINTSKTESNNSGMGRFRPFTHTVDSVTRGLRPWLNSTGIHAEEGFFNALPENFKKGIIVTTVPNKEWSKGDTYKTLDRVFIPSSTELGDIKHNNTYEIGEVYPYFKNAKKKDLKACLPQYKGGREYWTRSPELTKPCFVIYVAQNGAFGPSTGGAYYDEFFGMRPVINLSSDTLVTETPDENGLHEIVSIPELSEGFSIKIFNVDSNSNDDTVIPHKRFEVSADDFIQAVRNEDIELLNKYIEKGADVDVYDSRKFTPLHIAVLTEKYEIVSLLIKAGANIEHKTNAKGTPLHFAVFMENLEILDLLLKSGADTDACDIDGNAPIHYFVFTQKEKADGHQIKQQQGDNKESTEVIQKVKKLLIDAGADVNAKNNGGHNPLHIAAMFGLKEVAKELLEAGTEINVPLEVEQGISALHLAISGGYDELLELLLENGADTSIKMANLPNTNMLHYACYESTSLKIVKLLVEKGKFDLKEQDDRGYTPLHIATLRENEEHVKYFKEKGSDINIKDNDGKTPLQIAMEKNNNEIVDILKDE